MAGERHGMCELASRTSPPFIMGFACWYTKRRCLDVAMSSTQLCRSCAVCVYANNVGQQVGLYSIAQMFQKYNRRLNILRVCSAVYNQSLAWPGARNLCNPFIVHVLHNLTSSATCLRQVAEETDGCFKWVFFLNFWWYIQGCRSLCSLCTIP
jgi:hypothetical protein